MKRQKIVLATKSFKVDRRIHMFLFFIVAGFTILVFRLWTIQVYRAEDYEEFSKRNSRRPVPVQSIRGEILDCNGKILAKDDNYRDVWISLTYKEGRRIVTPAVKTSLELLAEILGKTYKRLEYDYLNKKRDSFNKHLEICVARKIPHQQYVVLEERKMEFPEEAMIFARKVPTRYYRYGSLAAHLLGITGPIDEDEMELERYADYPSYSLIGKSGIEKQYESYLHGTDGLNIITVDKNEIQRGPTQEIEPAIPGNNVVLNLDYDYQFAAEQILGASAGIMILSTTNNAVLAMASNPRYDLNEYRNKYGVYATDPKKPLYHRAVSGKYEPGSVFKLIESFPILEYMKLSPEYSVYCPGYFTKWTERWGCAVTYGHGSVNLYDAICRSCNVYFYSVVGEQMSADGGEQLRKWAIEFGLTDKTGIDLPDEPAASPFPSKKTDRRWTRGVGISNAIGQGGVLFSPIQVHTAICSIVNDGILYQPRLAQRIESKDGETIHLNPEISGVVEASTKTFEIIRKGMWMVCNHPRGTATRRLKVEGVEVAGKTGTAQAGNGLGNHAWFVCYAPFDNPQIVLTIMLEHDGRHGGEAAAPLAEKFLNVYFGNVSIKDLV